jgi:hypothetical protein
VRRIDGSSRRHIPRAAPALEIDEPHYQFRALWGQFLLHDWMVNTDLATDFLQRVVAAHDVDQVAAYFPYQGVLTSSSIGAFFEFYCSLRAFPDRQV